MFSYFLYIGLPAAMRLTSLVPSVLCTMARAGSPD